MDINTLLGGQILCKGKICEIKGHDAAIIWFRIYNGFWRIRHVGNILTSSVP